LDDAMDRRPQHPTRCRATALTAFTGPSRARASAPTAVNGRLERVKGIEPSSSAWKAVALPLSYTRTCSIFRGQQTQLALLLILNRGRRIKLGASQRNGYSPLLMLFPPGGHFARPGILYCCLRWPTSAGILSMWSRRRTIGRALWSWERTRHAITSPGR